MALGALHIRTDRKPVRGRAPEAMLYAAAVAGAGLLFSLIVIGQSRLAFMIGVAVPLICLAMVRIQLAIAAMIVYSVLLGDLRRLLIPIVGWSGQDPLLLVGAGFAIIIFGYALVSRAITLDTTLSRWTMGLTVIMVIQVFNPAQGGLVVGVAGIMFMLVPLLWYWIGRTYASQALTSAILYRIVVPLGLLAMLFGFYQVAVGYLPYQLQWYYIAGYTALGDPRDGLSPISFFSSGTEHGAFLITTVVLLWAVMLTKKQWAAIVLIIPLLVGVLATGSRGPVAKVLVVGCGMWALMGQSATTWAFRGSLAVVLAALGLFWSLTQAQNMEMSASMRAKLDRQADEFVDAASDSGEYSSSANHFQMMLEGYEYAMRHPLGFGLGATDKSVAKFGGKGHSTETDLGNSLIATGLPGGVAYHVMVVLIFASAIQFWKRTRSTTALAIIGVLGVNFLLWLTGGLYAISPIVWLCVGALDRFNRDSLKAASALT